MTRRHRHDHRPGHRAAVLDEWTYGPCRLQVLTSLSTAVDTYMNATYSVRVTHERETVTIGTGLTWAEAAPILREWDRAVLGGTE